MVHLKRILSLVVLITMSWSLQAQVVKEQSEKYARLLRLIDSYYVDSTSLDKLTEKAIVHVLSQLDPHSVYISKEEVDEANEPLQGSFDGIGVSFNILNDTLLVIQTIPGGPSEKVGIIAGDRIIQIDSVLVAGVGLTNQTVFQKLRGERGSKVRVSILRSGESELIDFEIIRDKIPIYSLDASYMLDEATGYIKLNRFSATTTEEFLQAMNKLQANKKMQNLVLDLRGNGGGFLKAAFEISDHFLDNGKMIVYTEGLKNPKKDYQSSATGVFKDGKLVVLIDGGSASASEIVSGAVQDWDRGIIIGRRSYGKGLVQQPYYLTDGSMLRLTTAHYYTPSGRCIQKPYEDGVEEYRSDGRERLSNGELFSKDSIKVNDSLVYKTLINKRNVYGGGGVIPDIFIPVDTSVNYRYYNQLVRRSIVSQYVLTYVDRNRKELNNTYPNFEAFKRNYKVTEAMLEALWQEGDKVGIERDSESINFISNYAKQHIKAIVARDLWSANEYYEIVNSDDKELIEAAKILKDTKRYNNILKGIYND
jgi:carboxyl-terminal processing protease